MKKSVDITLLPAVGQWGEDLSFYQAGRYVQAIQYRIREDLSTFSRITSHSFLCCCQSRRGNHKSCLILALEAIYQCQYGDTSEFIGAVSSSIHAIGATPEELIDAIFLKFGSKEFAQIPVTLLADLLASAKWSESVSDDIDGLTARIAMPEVDREYIKALVLSRHSQCIVQAASSLQRLLMRWPNDVKSAVLMARLLMGSGYTYHARRFICAALKKNPSNAQLLGILADTLYASSHWKAARTISAKMYDHTHDSISWINARFVLPRVPSSVKDLDRSLASFKELVNHGLHVSGLLDLQSSLSLATPYANSFYLAYQGAIPLRNYLESYNEIIRQVASRLLYQYGISKPDQLSLRESSRRRLAQAPSRDTRIRIGFISHNFYSHSNLQAHVGLIANLDRSRFELFVIHRPSTRRDMAHESLNLLVEHVVYLKPDFAQTVVALRGLSLDILYFTDIGMYPLDSILPMLRLAPYQVTGWGIPHTSGLEEIDFYLRSGMFSHCEPSDEYTEKLVTLEGAISCYDLPCVSRRLSRDYFLIPDDRYLVGCLQGLHKIHPDFDEYLEAIAQVDESILIVFVAAESDENTNRFAQRLKRYAPTAYSQSAFLKKMSIEEFSELTRIVDLQLDTIYYGAGVTFMQSAWCGAPFLTQSSNSVRSGVVSAYYQKLGVAEHLVACDKDDYLNKFNSLHKNKELVDDLRLAINKLSLDHVYGDKECVSSFSEFAWKLLR